MKLAALALVMACGGGGDDAPVDAMRSVLELVPRVHIDADGGRLAVSTTFLVTPMADVRVTAAFRNVSVELVRELPGNTYRATLPAVDVVENEVVTMSISSGGVVGSATVMMPASFVLTKTGTYCPGEAILTWSPTSTDPMGWGATASGYSNHQCMGSASTSVPREFVDTGTLTWSGCPVAGTDISCRAQLYLLRMREGALTTFPGGKFSAIQSRPF